MSKFKEERDKATEKYIDPRNCPQEGWTNKQSFNAGFNACLESSVVRELVRVIEWMLLDNNMHGHALCSEALTSYEQALAEIRGER